MINRLVVLGLFYLVAQFGITNTRAEFEQVEIPASDAKQNNVKSLSEFPFGIWEGVATNKLNDNDFRSFKVYSYRLGLIVIEYVEFDGIKKRYAVKVPPQYSTDNLDDDYLVDEESLVEDEELSFNLLSPKKAILYTDKNTIILRKKRRAKVKMSELLGTWQAEYDDQTVSLSIDENFNLTIKNSDHIAEGSIKHDGAAGLFIALDSYDEKIISPVFLIDKSNLELPSDSDTNIIVTKVNSQPQSTFLRDDNGNAVTIDKLSITTTLSELVAQTTIDLSFTNPNRNSSEVAFKLPLPSDAIVVSYSLDIEGKMISSSAVEKNKARQAFEEIQSRGVDPALAEVSNNNQFTTEIFPVDYQQQRRIILRYVEPINKMKRGVSSYSFPLHKMGHINSLDIHVTSQYSKPKITGLGKGVKKERVMNSNKSSWQFQAHATGHTANAPFNIRLKPINVKRDKDIRSQLSQAIDGQRYFSVWGQVPELSKPKKTVGKVVIAWDNSLSMRDYHSDYIELMTHYLPRLEGVDVTVVNFANNAEELSFASGNEKNMLKKVQNIEYDSASNFQHLDDILQRDADYFVVLSDGLATFSTDFLAVTSKPVFTISPAQGSVNAPLLKSLAKQGNYFQLSENNKQGVAKAIGTLPPVIEVSSNSHNISDIVISRPYGFNSRFLINAKVNNAQDAEITLDFGDKKTQTIVIDATTVHNSEEAKYLWAQSSLQPLLASPKKHQEMITEFGKKYKIATPFTSLIVLEELDDYVRYGIEPPSEIEGWEQYNELRVEVVSEQRLREEESLDLVLRAWKARLTWWEDPLGSFEKRNKSRQRNTNQPSEGGGLERAEEIVVSGIRASAAPGPSIGLEPWLPDTPYMKAILAKAKGAQYQEYLVQRNQYESNVSFYMDVAKHFFDQGESELGVKVVLNILEVMPDRPTMQRTVAYVLMQYQKFEIAISVLEKVDLAYPFQATSKRDLARAWQGLGKQHERADDYSKALRYYVESATKVDDDPQGLPVVALTEMNNLLPQAQAIGVDTSWINPEFITKQTYDVRALLSWSNNQTDVDLYVLDPNEFTVYYGKRYSPIGGYLPHDDRSGFGPEVFLLKNGTSGEYKINAKYYSDDTAEAFGPVTLILDLYLNYGKENEQHKTTSIRVDREKDEVEVGTIRF